jgi:hypothetical protein
MEEEVKMYQSLTQQPHHTPWNKGTLSGQKRPLKLQEIWGIRIRLQLEGNVRNLADYIGWESMALIGIHLPIL